VSASSTVVIGIGNSLRRDDGVGLCVASMIEELAIEGVTVIEGVGDGYALVEAWSDCNRAIVVDCTVSGNAAGRIFRFDALSESIPADLFNGYSTHSISAVDAVELGKVLGRVPQSLIIFGIEGEDVSPGEGLTPKVEEAAARVAGLIAEELSVNIS
jgi:hydrogenase maturation protease